MREVEDLEEAKVSGARGSKGLMDGNGGTGYSDEGTWRPDKDCFLNHLLLKSFRLL